MRFAVLLALSFLEYTKSKWGFNPIRVAIAMDENRKITSVRVVDQHEVEELGADLLNDPRVFDKLIGQPIDTAEIDVKSGVTLTSDAINDVLRQAAMDAVEANVKVYEATGFQKIKLEISVKDGVIVSAVCKESNETPGLGADLLTDEALSVLVGQEVANAQYDAKSGATLTSNAIKDVLRQAAVDTTEADVNVYEATGFQKIKLEIGVKDGRIVSAVCKENKETPGFGADLLTDEALSVLIGQEVANAQYDVKSGVTLTSNAINNVLRQAAMDAVEANVKVYEATGFQKIKLEIGVKDGVIVSAVCKESNETPGLGADLLTDEALSVLVGQEVANVQYDVKSGVTLTSNAIKDVLHQAREAALQREQHRQIVLINDKVNFRSRATSSGTSLARISKGTVLTVLDEVSDGTYLWYKVEYNGQEGYIRADMAQIIEEF